MNGYQIVSESLKLYPDLSKYEKMYDKFDEAHSREHLIRVRVQALKLAKKYLPEKLKLVYIAATLHDIGLSKDRENHEDHGAKMILKDPYLKTIMTSEELSEVADAVKNHRASSGKPETILGKIISDADRSGVTTSYTLYRAITYGIHHYKDHDLNWYIDRAIDHLHDKYGLKGRGRRSYFPETDKILNDVFEPILRLKNDKDRIKKAWNLVHPKHKEKIKGLIKK